MGKYNFAVNQLLERKDIFADFVNGTLHGGKQVVHAEQLELISPHSGLYYEDDSGKKRVIERFGDIRMRADTKAYSVIFAEETQEDVHYAMPVRMMLYSALEYTKQIKLLEPGDMTSGMRKEDKLIPIVNIVFYLGDHWDGSRRLHEMLDLDWESEEVEELKQYLPDFQIRVIEAGNIAEPENYETCLQPIFYMLKYNRDKKKLYDYMNAHREELKRMDRVEQTAALVLLGEQKRLAKILEEGEDSEEGIDMCKAIDDLILDGEKRGEKRGERRGERRGEKRGEERGEKRGESQLAALTQILLDAGEMDLLKEALADKECREKLYIKYQIKNA